MTAPFRSVGGADAGWGGSEPGDEELATNAFPAVDPLAGDEGEAFEGNGRTGDEDEYRPPWW
ncbi:MAG TPA: hypothetical protein VHJ17_00665 [Thermomonospora sp.]|nr:hypothetical protein [Thermomonospora sp.]